MIFKIAALIVIALLAFVAWRYTSVARGAKARDKALLERLDPLAARFEAGAEVSAGDIRQIAEAPELRPMLHALLSHYAATDLFPAEYISQEAQAESTLVYWMLHPNELQAAPSAIEPVEKLNRQIDGRRGLPCISLQNAGGALGRDGLGTRTGRSFRGGRSAISIARRWFLARRCRRKNHSG
jgi:hypothetical protein